MEAKKKKLGKDAIHNIIILSVIAFVILMIFLIGIIFKDSDLGKAINDNVVQFFDVVSLVKNKWIDILISISIIFLVWALNQIVKMVSNLIIRKAKGKTTVWIIIKSIFKYASVIVGGFVILNRWGVDMNVLLASAGILGLALSFGAQSLIEDVLSGLFLIFEKEFEVGDIIQVNSFRGKVVEIGVRTTTFEEVGGDIMTMNNSDIRSAINTSKNLHPAVCDIPVTYGADLPKVEKIINSHLGELKDKIPDIVEGPFYKGVQTLSDSGVVLRIVARAEERHKYQVMRDLNKEMKLLFDKEGIEIPFNQLVVHIESDKKD